MDELQNLYGKNKRLLCTRDRQYTPSDLGLLSGMIYVVSEDELSNLWSIHCENYSLIKLKGCV